MENRMITIDAVDLDCWTSCLRSIILESPHLDENNIHISVNKISFREDAKNILWLNETYPLINDILNLIEKDDEKFASSYSKIYTWNNIYKKYSHFKESHPSCSAWVNPCFLPLKNKNISLISSNKKMFEGHYKRLHLVEKFSKVKDFYGNEIDIFGRGIRPIDNKADGLIPYRFSIAIENDIADNWYTEKILDCFLTCTVPIYYGSESVYQKFNKNGIIRLDDNFDLMSITQEKYNTMLDSIIENFYIAKKENVDPSETLKKIIIENI
jgi:hypothetical protein